MMGQSRKDRIENKVFRKSAGLIEILKKERELQAWEKNIRIYNRRKKKPKKKMKKLPKNPILKKRSYRKAMKQIE